MKNLNTVQKFFFILPLALAVLSPFVTLAASAPVNYNVWSPSILKGPLVTCTGTGDGSVKYACESLCDLMSTFANVVYFFIGVVIWIVTPIMFAWSGILFILSRGNTGRTGEARKMITGTVIGILIVLCGYLIIYTFLSVLSNGNLAQLGVGGFGTSVCPLQS